MDHVVSQELEVPAHLILQLEEILKYSKTKIAEGSTGLDVVGPSNDKNVTEQHLSLERFPGLGSLISSLEGFRNGLKKQDWTQKSVEGKLLFST